MQYRREIDGLRAVAVLPVIFYHAGFHLFRGGFVGVDVFFVISGYLITTLIVQDLELGGFSIVRFYERRARRILPALSLVMFASLVTAWFWLLPLDMEDLSKSLVAVPLFVSNILFWRTSGYFDISTELKPAIHTWSLAVEEQYYLLFPIFLILAWRLGKRWVLGLMLVFGTLSLAVAQWGSQAKPSATFYLLPTRGWEILIGAGVALYLSRKNLRSPNRATSEACAVVGAVLLAFSTFAFDSHTPFPSLYTLAPTLGTALLILFATEETLMGRFLGNPLFVSIGLISYSAYLWHQPLFAFARNILIDDPSMPLMSALALLSLLLAFLTWRFVERPFRDKRTFTRQQVGAIFAVASLTLIAFGLAGVFSKGFLNRAKWKGSARTLSVLQERGDGEKYCTAHAIRSSLGPLVCRIGDPNAQPDGVLWGDSFAGALMYGLNNELKDAGHSFYVVSSDGCIPVVGDSRTVLREFNCTYDRHRTFLKEVINDPSIHTIVWVGAFANMIGRHPETDYLINGASATPDLAKESILDTLKVFQRHTKHVVFVGDPPRFPYNTYSYATKKMLQTGDPRSGIQILSRTSVVDNLNESDLLTAVRKYASVIYPIDLFCERDVCPSHDPQENLLYIDGGHLSHLGSTILARAVRSELGVDSAPGTSRSAFRP